MRISLLTLALTALFVTAACAQNATQPSASDSAQGTVASEMAPTPAMPMQETPMMMGSNCGCASYAAPMTMYSNQPGMIRQVVYQQPIIQQPIPQTYGQPSYTQGYPQTQFASRPCGCGQSIQGQQVSAMINTPTPTASTPIYQDPVDQNFTQPESQPCCGNTGTSQWTTTYSDPCCQTRTRGFGSRIFRRYR